MNVRLYYFDNIKYLLIFFVVFGHMLQPFRQMSYNSEIYSMIYMFHMPLFIIISGYFSKKSSLNTIKKGCLLLFETFIALHLLSIIVKFILSGDIAIKDLVIPGFASWYILSLILWRFILQFIPVKWLNHIFLVLSGSVVVSLLAGYIPIGGAFSVQRTFAMFPFFLMGYIIRQTDSLQKFRMSPIIAGMLIVLFVAVVLNFNYIGDLGGGKNEFHNVMHCTYHYYKGHDFISHPLLYRLMYIVFSLFLSFAVMSIVPQTDLGIISREGQYTLFYYFWHSIVSLALRKLMVYMQLPTNTMTLFVASLLIMLILLCLRKNRTFTLLMNPISSFIKA